MRPLGFPITRYKNDPATTRVEEWHEIWGAHDSGKWYLCERYGVWNENDKQAPVNVPVLTEPFDSENEMGDSIDARIQKLDSEGWKHKYQAYVDMRLSRLVGRRIE
jgi:hypothetical protein